MTHCEYNGWYNYETWLTSLWIDNEQWSYNYWRVIARTVCESAQARYDWETDQQAAIAELAERLRSWVEDNAPTVDKANLYADLMNAAISEINFREITEHWVDEVWADARPSVT